MSLAAYVAEDGIIGKRGLLVLQTLYAPVQRKAKAKKWESVGWGAGQGEGIGDFQRKKVGNVIAFEM